MKHMALIIMMFMRALGSLQAQNNPDQIIGLWLSENKDGKIEIYKQANQYFGKLVWGKDMFEADGVTSKKDTKNPDPQLRKRNLQNLVLLTRLHFDGEGWTGGDIYDPQSGKTYSCSLKIKGNKLLIRGFIGISLLGRTTEWTRVTQ